MRQLQRHHLSRAAALPPVQRSEHVGAAPAAHGHVDLVDHSGLPARSAVRRTDGQVVGSVLVEPGARDDRTEISYQLLPEHWGHGYAREAMTVAVDWAAAALPGRELIAVTQEANTRSRRLLDALGGTLAERFVDFGQPQVLYRLPAPAS